MEQSLKEKYGCYGIIDIYRRTGKDWGMVEGSAYVDAVEGIALDGDGNEMPYGIQMSLCAADFDRSKSVLEFEDVGSLEMKVCADIILFRDEVSRSNWERGDFTVYYSLDGGVKFKERKGLVLQ